MDMQQGHAEWTYSMGSNMNMQHVYLIKKFSWLQLSVQNNLIQFREIYLSQNLSLYEIKISCNTVLAKFKKYEIQNFAKI